MDRGAFRLTCSVGCGHPVREYVQSAVCGQTENWESRSWTSSIHSQRSTVVHTLFFKEAPVDRLLARRGSNQRWWPAAYGERLPREGTHADT